MSARSIMARLAVLRRQLTWWLAIDGASRLAFASVVVIAIDFVLDWSFQMDRPQRVVMLLLVVAASLAVAYRWLWQPLQGRPSEDALCLQVEDQYPELGQALISALQLSRLEIMENASSVSMRQATIKLGNELASRIDPLTVLDQRRQRRNLAVLVFAAVSLTGTAVSVFATDSMAIWFNRNVLLGHREWPQDIHFQIHGAEDGLLTLPRHEDWPIEGVVTADSRRLPQEVWLERRDSTRRQRMELLEGGRRWHADLSGVTDGTEFRLVEARAASEWQRVRLVDRPEVRSLDLSVIPPAYTEEATENLPAGGGPYKVMQGSQLRLVGHSTKSIATAVLNVAGVAHSLALTDGTQFAITLTPEQLRDGDYSLELTDRELVWSPGRSEPQPLKSRDPATFRLRLNTDREPQVTAKLNGIGTLVTDRAGLPLSGQATDDFAITRFKLQHRRRIENEEGELVGTAELKPRPALPARETDIEHVLELQPLQLTAGSSLSFVLEATDNNNVTGPNTGRSAVFMVRVVTDEELRAAFLARERDLRIEFEKQIKIQDELRTDTAALRATARNQPELPPEQRDQLAKLERRQKALGEDVAKLAHRFSDIVVELRNNRLEEHQGLLQTRLTTRIAQPLENLGRDSFAPVIVLLERTRQRESSPADRDLQFVQTTDAQQRLLEKMREILQHMEQAEGFQEAVNQLLEVQKAQLEVIKRTEKEKTEAIRRLLEGTGKAKP